MPLIKSRATGLFLACLFGILLAPAPATAQGNDDVVAAYQRFYRGDKDGARADFERMVAAGSGRLSARFGLLQVLKDDADTNRTMAAEVERRIDAFITDAEARHDRSGTDDEALFYLANAHLLRATFRFEHDRGIWGAARDGARSKRLADAYVKRHPEHGDAYFVLGTYNYYVEIAPAFIKLIRPLLFLPAGNRTEGLKQIERAYTQGSMFAFPAGMLLMEIYGAFEGRAADGVRIGETLARTYPDNPEVPFQLAELYLGPAVEDYAGAAAQYEKAIASESRRVPPREALFRGQLGLAASRLQQWRLDDGIRILTKTIDAPPATPAWALPVFLLRRANYRALTGDPGAIEDINRVLRDPAWKDRHKQADGLLKWANARRASGEADIYAALVRGNRLAAERQWDEAAAAYEPVRRDHPDDLQVRYRLASLQFARGDAAGAAGPAAALAADRRAPGWIRAQALLIVAREHDLAGRRDLAKKAYNEIIEDYEREAAVWPARVGLVTPYRRRP